MAYERDNLDKLVEETETYLNEKKYVQAREAIIDLEPFDIAYVMEALPEDTIPVMFRLLPKELAAEVFVELDTDSQESLIKGFSRAELKEVIDELYLDDAVDIIEEMPANVVKRILATADPAPRRSINPSLRNTVLTLMPLSWVNASSSGWIRLMMGLMDAADRATAASEANAVEM